MILSLMYIILIMILSLIYINIIVLDKNLCNVSIINYDSEFNLYGYSDVLKRFRLKFNFSYYDNKKIIASFFLPFFIIIKI